ncbi:MAG: zinc-binding dehydrogenase [Acidimicrobiaceae bacterium]|nr:zinc-binding dehydrogenase [Acidimicrobiaceae bacterium]
MSDRGRTRRPQIGEAMIGHITDPAAEGGLARRELPELELDPHDTVIGVRAYSVNRGELNLLRNRPDGWRPGQDVSGVVVRQAADGTGPEAGVRVAGHADGGSWSEWVGVPSHRVAPIPDGTSFADAAALPAAGLTAFRALQTGGPLLGKRVLVTGASGGVGHLAVQLASLAGANVTGLVSGPQRREALAGLDAEVVTSLDGIDGPFDLVLEGVGGQVLIDAIHHVAPGATVAALGMASGERSNFAFNDFPWGKLAWLVPFYLWATPEETFADDLAYLARLVGDGRLEVRWNVRRDWSETVEAVSMLRERQATGKVVLTIS